MNWGVLRDQPYGVVIEPLIRGSVDALRQHCPTKRLTPMGLLGNVWLWKCDGKIRTWRLAVENVCFDGVICGCTCGKVRRKSWKIGHLP